MTKQCPYCKGTGWLRPTRAEQVVALLKEHHALTSRDVVDLTDMSASRARQVLLKLRKQGTIYIAGQVPYSGQWLLHNGAEVEPTHYAHLYKLTEETHDV